MICSENLNEQISAQPTRAFTSSFYPKYCQTTKFLMLFEGRMTLLQKSVDMDQYLLKSMYTYCTS